MQSVGWTLKLEIQRELNTAAIGARKRPEETRLSHRPRAEDRIEAAFIRAVEQIERCGLVS